MTRTDTLRTHCTVVVTGCATRPATDERDAAEPTAADCCVPPGCCPCPAC